MNNDMDANLDLLDLEDDSTLDALPDAAPFAAPRPKKPWLLLGIGVLVIILATYVIIRTIGSDSRSSIEIDLDAPEIVTVDGAAVAPAAPENPTPAPVPAPAPVAAPVEVVAPAPVQPAPAPAAQPSNATPGVPVRVVADRADVTFKPDQVAPAPKPTAKPAAKPATKKPATTAKPAAKKPAPKPQVARGSWYVQFGSYSTRELAEKAERQIRAGHQNLFAGKQFVILAAVLPNGTTTYRLRIAFADSAAANGFCRNAKLDGVDCYVAK